MNTLNDSEFERLLNESVKTHGHLCPGQVLGVRMSLFGLGHIGIEDPRGRDRKNLLVFVEMDRCATDAIRSVTGCSLGKRTMKFLDYGKMAATFMNLSTGKAVRVVAREDAREKAKSSFPEIADKYTAQLHAYKIMQDKDLFDHMAVDVVLKPEDMPGRPLQRVQCSMCGEYVQDRREIDSGGKILCRPCAHGGYYRADPFLLKSVVQKSHSGFEIRSKLWIESEGEPVFGKGRMMLLKAIDRYGSINQAAQEISISYRKAWSYIKAMEKRLGMKLVHTRAGGKHGGGACLSDDARSFLEKYEALDNGMIEMVDERFDIIFGRDRHV